MNKRSAVVTAGGLAASFMAGAAAVAFNWGLGATAPSSVSAAATLGPTATKPRVRHRTIVVHKKARGGTPTPGRTVIVPAPSPVASSPAATTGGSAVVSGEHDDSDSMEHDD
jgi:hypothetical protein